MGIVISYLQQISVRRRIITKLSLFLLRQLLLRRIPIPLLILGKHHDAIRDARDDGQDRKGDGDGITRNKLGRILLEEGKHGDDATNVAESDLPRASDRSPSVTAEVHVEPAHDDGHGRVRAHGDEEERRVLHLGVVVHAKQDGEARDGNEDGKDGKRRAVSDLVRDEGDHHGEAECDGPRGNTVKLCLHRAVAERLDDAGRKVGVTIGGDDEAKVHESSEDDLGVLEDIENITKRRLALSARAALIGPEPRGDIVPLLGCQPLGLLGEVGQEEVEEEAGKDGQGTLEDKDPAPAGVTPHAAHLADGGGEQTTECAGESGAVEEEGVSALGFVTSVPHADEVEG